MGLTFRTTRSDGAILAVNVYDSFPVPMDIVEGAAEAAGEQACAALDEGYSIILEVLDDEGDIFPAGRWVLVHRAEP